MNSDQARDAVGQLLRVKRSKKIYHYWACAKGPDDLPVLIVAKKEGPLRKEARASRKEAKAKIDAYGQVRLSDQGVFLFVVERGSLQPPKMQKLVRTKLATDPSLRKVAPLLRKAVVLALEAYEAQVESGDVAVAEVPDASDFERLYERAEDALAPVRAALRSHPTHGPEADRLHTYLLQSQSVFDGGETDVAKEMLSEVVEGADALVSIAWRVESAAIREKYGTVRSALKEAHAGAPDAFTLAFRPLEALQQRALEVRDDGDLARAFEVLAELDRALDEVLFPAEEATPEELRALDLELAQIVVPHDDPTQDDGFDGLTDAELARVVTGVRVGQIMRDGDAAARHGLSEFIEAFRSDGELSSALPIEAAEGLYALLPDVGQVVKLTERVIASDGSEDALAILVAAVSALEPTLDSPRLAALESTDLGRFSILTPLEVAVEDALSALS